MCVPSPFASLSKSNDVHTRKSFNHIPITFLFIAHTHRAKYARSAEREKSHIIKITNGNKYRTVFRPVGRYRYQFQLVFHICGVYFINGWKAIIIILHFIFFFIFSVFLSLSLLVRLMFAYVLCIRKSQSLAAEFEYGRHHINSMTLFSSGVGARARMRNANEKVCACCCKIILYLLRTHFSMNLVLTSCEGKVNMKQSEKQCGKRPPPSPPASNRFKCQTMTWMSIIRYVSVKYSML